MSPEAGDLNYQGRDKNQRSASLQLLATCLWQSYLSSLGIIFFSSLSTESIRQDM